LKKDQGQRISADDLIRMTLRMPCKIAAASSCPANVIVTRHKPDFVTSTIPVMNLEEFGQQRQSKSAQL
jgi:hypothetical protein